MTRREFIERNSRQILGGFAADEETITFPLINSWLGDAISMAAKTNYTDAIKLDGIGYVNNSFYTTFKGITVSKDENFLWKLTLPQIPVGVGYNEGISNLRFKSSDGEVSMDCIPLTINQQGYSRNMRPIPNRVLYYSEGIFCYVLTTLMLSDYTASVTLISGGDSTSLDSVLNVPSDYFPLMVEYLKNQLILERQQPADATNDGQSAPRIT